MISLALLAVFVLSNAAIVAGYYNYRLEDFSHAVRLVYDLLPVVSTAVALTIALPAGMLLSFYASRGSYSAYKGNCITYASLVPPFIALSLLPGDLDAPKPLFINALSRIGGVAISQLVGMRIAAATFWERGGRTAEAIASE
jgi:hypothetical protein